MDQVVRRVAVTHYARQKGIKEAVARRLAQIWAQVDPADVRDSYLAGPLQSAAVALNSGQFAAASQAADYLEAVLAAQGAPPVPVRVNPAAFAGQASDSRPLGTLLLAPMVATMTALGRGVLPREAMASGLASMLLVGGTQVADAGRAADQVAMTAREDVEGWVRVLVGRSCSRCAVLAGKVYKWDADFNRHPLCDCRAIPIHSGYGQDLTSDPNLYFESLPAGEQDRLFTKAGAKAIREGADVGQVVNARRGMSTAVVAGKRLKVTTEGTTKRGLASTGFKGPRLMPAEIYRLADSREEAVEMLRRYKFLF